MRLDLFLKASRLVIRRTIAQQLCEKGRVKLNGVTAKASKEVNVQDLIEITRGDNRTIARVVEVPGSKQVSKRSAGSLIEIVSTVKSDDTLLP